MEPERILALALATMLLVNAVQVFLAARTKRIAAELKEESAKIHELVNSRLTLALAANAALAEQNAALVQRIAALTEKGV